jgi:hypothetical protein
LSQKHAHLVVFSDNNLLHRSTSAIPNKDIRTSLYGQLDESKILSSGGLMKKSCAGSVVDV